MLSYLCGCRAEISDEEVQNLSTRWGNINPTISISSIEGVISQLAVNETLVATCDENPYQVAEMTVGLGRIMKGDFVSRDGAGRTVRSGPEDQPVGVARNDAWAGSPVYVVTRGRVGAVPVKTARTVTGDLIDVTSFGDSVRRFVAGQSTPSNFQYIYGGGQPVWYPPSDLVVRDVDWSAKSTVGMLMFDDDAMVSAEADPKKSNLTQSPMSRPTGSGRLTLEIEPRETGPENGPSTGGS